MVRPNRRYLETLRAAAGSDGQDESDPPPHEATQPVDRRRIRRRRQPRRRQQRTPVLALTLALTVGAFVAVLAALFTFDAVSRLQQKREFERIRLKTANELDAAIDDVDKAVRDLEHALD